MVERPDMRAFYAWTSIPGYAGFVLTDLKRIWLTFRDWRDGRARRRESIGPASLTWNPRGPIYVRAWRHYCVGLLRSELLRRPRAVDLAIDEVEATAGTYRRIGFQYEHTVVRPGGGDSTGAPPSRTPLADGKGVYLARLLHREAHERCDRVIEYSEINRVHLERAGGFEEHLARTVVLAPLLYPLDTRPRARRQRMITLFSDEHSGRRAVFLQEARAAGLPVVNRRRAFAARVLRRLLRDTRILVNLRRTNDHHTIEELRILPALLCGVVVVSEDGPLRELLPYQQHIVWASRERLVEAVRAVDADYPAWRARLIECPDLPAVIARMADDNARNVASMLDGLGSSAPVRCPPPE
jgi:hypothetical protein